MDIELSHFTLYPPDELLPHWWVMHDFAGELGLEVQHDAAKELRKVLPPGTRMDYESDFVFIQVSKSERVVPTLRAIYERLGWDPAELTRLEAEVMAFRRPRPHRIAVGDVFVIPVEDELVALGQVLDKHYGSPTVAVFPDLARVVDIDPATVVTAVPLTIVHIGGDSLYKGLWTVVSSQAVTLDPGAGPDGRNGEVGSCTYGGDGPVVDLLKAHSGLGSWDIDPRHRSRYLRKLVMLYDPQQYLRVRCGGCAGLGFVPRPSLPSCEVCKGMGYSLVRRGSAGGGAPARGEPAR